jgi:ATP-grasp domain-containing protein
MERAIALARTFGRRPLIVKDYVKSRKHEWAEACFVPDATDAAAVERVVGRFLELTGSELQGGLVLREFLELERVGKHARSGMPLAREWRVFWLDREPVMVAPYWPEVGGDPPRVETFSVAAARVQSRFFTMDLARRATGDWIIVELGDGQVAGLPDGTDATGFFRAIVARLAQAP